MQRWQWVGQRQVSSHQHKGLRAIGDVMISLAEAPTIHGMTLRFSHRIQQHGTVLQA